MPLEHEQNYGLGMDAVVIVCPWNTTKLCFGHGCCGNRMLLEHERNYGLGMDALGIVCSGNTNGIMVWAGMLWLSCALGTRTLLWFGHKCSGYRKRWKHERYYGLGLDALVRMHLEHERHIRACMLRLSYALGTRTLFWFGHGCSGYLMLLEHERYDGLGMDAVVLAHTRNTNVIMVWALLEQSAWYICSIPRALETLRRCASCHASHIRRGRQSMHVFAFTLRRNQEQ